MSKHKSFIVELIPKYLDSGYSKYKLTPYHDDRYSWSKKRAKQEAKFEMKKFWNFSELPVRVTHKYRIKKVNVFKEI